MTETQLRRFAIYLACLPLLSACHGSASQTANGSEAPPGEWKTLFNGRDLEGWHSYGETAANPGWIVEDGAIVLDVGEDTTEMTGGDLITNEQYENFELELEWKLSEGGNSGVFFGVQRNPGTRGRL